jgi:predicted SprT family Zn-dependent metalloprotease
MIAMPPPEMDEVYTGRDCRPKHWSWFDNIVMDHHARAIGPLGVMVYMFLVRHCDNATGEAWISLATMQKRLNLCRNTLRKTVKHLFAYGLIYSEERAVAKDGKVWKQNVYQILDPSPLAVSQRQERLTYGGHAMTPVISCAPRGSCDAPSPDSSSQTLPEEKSEDVFSSRVEEEKSKDEEDPPASTPEPSAPEAPPAAPPPQSVPPAPSATADAALSPPAAPSRVTAPSVPTIVLPRFTAPPLPPEPPPVPEVAALPAKCLPGRHHSWLIHDAYHYQCSLCYAKITEAEFKALRGLEDPHAPPP